MKVDICKFHNQGNNCNNFIDSNYIYLKQNGIIHKYIL
jgi:hypothetical protein